MGRCEQREMGCKKWFGKRLRQAAAAAAKEGGAAEVDEKEQDEAIAGNVSRQVYNLCQLVTCNRRVADRRHGRQAGRTTMR